jgi:hypothetical protein
MNTGRQYVGGFGTISASVAFGGEPPTTATEEYDGTNWTTVNSMNVSRGQAAGAGIQTAGLAISGEDSAPSLTNATEEYDGTSWVAGGTVATARRLISALGIQTAALAFGGVATPGLTGATEEYNGTSWTTSNSLNTARYQLAAAGTQTAGLAFGGVPPPTFAGLQQKNMMEQVGLQIQQVWQQQGQV